MRILRIVLGNYFIFFLLTYLIGAGVGFVGISYCQPAGDQSAILRGVVLSTVDKKPIPGALVSLTGSHRSMLTDDKGEFTFSGVSFGTENVGVKKSGFLCFLKRSRQQPKCFQGVQVSSSDIEVTLTMTPQAVVTGRIVDQTGEPVANLDLFLMYRNVENGLFVWEMVGASSSKTNTEGVYRIVNQEPGTYLLRNSSVVDSYMHVGLLDNDHGYAATYYPGTPSQSAAKPIVVHAGEEFKADMKVSHDKFQPVSLTFAWNHEWHQGGTGWSLSSTMREDYLYSDFDSSHNLIHLFAPAGDYKLQFTIAPPGEPNTGNPSPWPDGTKQRYMGSVKFTVKDQPVTLTEIPSQPPLAIPLHVRAEFSQQEKRKAAVPQNNVYFPPAASFELSGGQVQFDNQFSWRADRGPSDFAFPDIPPGHYIIKTSAFQETYIASLTCGGTNLLREPLVVGPGIPICSIEAVVRDDVATLAVGFTPQAIAQMNAVSVAVTDLALIPVENLLDLPYSSLIRQGSEPKKVTIPPGSYLVFLFDGRAIAWRDPDVRKQLMSLGTIVNLAPGQSKTILLDWRSELNDSQPAGVAFGRVLP